MLRVITWPQKTVVGTGADPIVHGYVAGVGSTLPAASRARTRNSRKPTGSAAYSFGDVQASNVCSPSPRFVYTCCGYAQSSQSAAAVLSRRHSYRRLRPAVRLSLPEKRNVAVVLVVGLAGPLKICVLGAISSGPSVPSTVGSIVQS